MHLLLNKNYSHNLLENDNYKNTVFNKVFVKFTEIKDKTFIDCNFVEVDFGETDVINSKFINCNFTNCTLHHTNFKNCLFENINASNFDLRAGLLVQNTFKDCIFFSSCFRGSKFKENDICNFISNYCDMKNIIFEKNKYETVLHKFSNLFKSKFIDENLKMVDFQDCNNFLCIYENSTNFENLNIDKHSIIK